MNYLLMILFQVFLIMLNAVFACAEIAVLSINENKLEKMANEGNKKARRLRKLTSQPAKFLATIQVAITLSGFLGSAFAAGNFASPVVSFIISLGINIPEATLHSIAVVVITLILSYFTLVFGELVPKRVAMKKAESLSLSLSGPLSVIAKLFAPLVWLLTASTNGILRLLGIDPNQNEEEVSEEDIKLMIDVGSKKGAIDSTEQEIIQNVFAFDDLTAGEIAIHRTDVVILFTEESLDEWDKTIHENRYTFYPVCSESKDNIVGVLNAKDFFRLGSEKRSMDLVMEKAVSRAYLIPEGVKADVLFSNMKKTGNRFAIVIDEYGGMAGIVTITNLLECLVGDISNDDEAQTSGKYQEITKLGEDSWSVPGESSIDEVEKELGIKLEAGGYNTFGGLVFSALGSIPADGTTLDVMLDGLSVKVTEIEDHQLVSSIVTVIKENNDEQEEE